MGQRRQISARADTSLRRHDRCDALIEHLAEPVRLLRWIGERAPPRAKIYLEWPNPNSMQLPKRSELSERGIDVVISNFTDDLTHRETPDLSTCCRWLGEAGFTILSSGTIDIG